MLSFSLLLIVTDSSADASFLASEDSGVKLGYETVFTYSAGDDILKQEDSLGRTTLYEYDVLHNLTKVTDSEGGITGYTYDVRSNLVCIQQRQSDPLRL